ncbi:pur operon repressor [Sinanaerobacter chloroacetimidivorans]|jgi:purine operon repressor|uniref:Pur operon repressor n=1 Tax=Sinanaerobacter chloroacetimidivorans TaxID=2818044 RepID=A0A8J8B3L5_9FIRM|nr:pur operon repressor [Sinanaerobacter chloroacetimidivorans]MBR0600444.1 pur operon repressor [Sinanaerobacter chloroacetimidivorans]
MKRTERVGAIIRILSENPCKPYSLGYFCDLFSAAKSSISEDIQTAKQILAGMELGIIETTAGAGGGVRYVPHISEKDAMELLDHICEKLRDKNRILGGGFLYTSDLMFDSNIVKRAGEIFARRFMHQNADYVVTIETKGIPVALMTAHMLNLPLVVIRRESKISEGSTVSINYFSGSTERIQKMSISKRAVTPGSRAIIIDDFMRAGGSIKGISDMLSEFEIENVGTGVVIASTEPQKKKIQDYFPLIYLGPVDENGKTIEVFPNSLIFCKKDL